MNLIEELYQLDFFKDSDFCRIEAELARTQESLSRVRKGTFARINLLQKLYNEIKEDHEIFKRNICRERING